MASKNNYLWIGIAVIVLILAFVFVLNTNSSKKDITGNVVKEFAENTEQINKANSQVQVTCNSPYIQVGTSCCLDQNSNNICDKNETIGQESSNNVWKELYETECYGKDNLISKSQAENIAKHYAVIQTNNNAENPISTGDIKTKFPTSTIGEKCNPDWFVQLEIDYMNKYSGQETTARYFITVSGERVNETLQGATFLPNDYVFQKVEASVDYHGNSDNIQFIGGSETHGSPFTNIP